MAYVSINIDKEFLDDSFDNYDEIIRKPILPKNLNLKQGMTIYKKKLEEKKKQDKSAKIEDQLETEKLTISHSPKKWRCDTEDKEENFYFSNEKKLNNGNYVINVQNMKLSAENLLKNYAQPAYNYRDSIALQENFINKQNSKKGNLFRNTSRSLKFKDSLNNPFARFENKTIKKKTNENRLKSDNFLKNRINLKPNSDLNLNFISNNTKTKKLMKENETSMTKETEINNESMNVDKNLLSINEKENKEIVNETENNNIKHNESCEDNNKIDNKQNFNISKPEFNRTAKIFNMNNLNKNSTKKIGIKENHNHSNSKNLELNNSNANKSKETKRSSSSHENNVMNVNNTFNPKSLIEFTYQPNKTSSTIYTVLNKRKKEFFENIRLQNKKNSTLEPTKDLLNQKKSFHKTNNITSLLEKKKKDFIPYVFPVAWLHPNNFTNISEKNRYEKITDLFLKLRVYLIENPDNEITIAKEFLIKHGVFEKELLMIDKLSNFIEFIKSEECLRINPSRALKDLIIDACFYNEAFENENEENESVENFQSTENNLAYSNTAYNSNFNNNCKLNMINKNLKSEYNEYYSSSNVNNNVFNLNGNILKNNIINNYGKRLYNNSLLNASNMSQTNVNFSNFNLQQQQKRSFSNFIGLNNQHKSSINQSVTNQNFSTITNSHNFNHNSINTNFNFNSDKNINLNTDGTEGRNNAILYPILDEKSYKIEYDNPKAVIENLAPEIAKIKGLTINNQNDHFKNYNKNNQSKNKNKLLNYHLNASSQLPAKDIEQIKKKNKLLEYIILQRSQNRLKLENEQKVFELEFNNLKFSNPNLSKITKKETNNFNGNEILHEVKKISSNNVGDNTTFLPSLTSISYKNM